MQTSAIGTLLPIEPCNSLPESGTWCFVFVPRGHAVAQKMSGNLLPTIKRFLLFSPCAPPRSDASGRRFRRALMKQLAIRLSWQTTPAKSLVMFESRSKTRVVRLARSSCAAPLACSWSREPRRGGKPGRRFLDYFLWPHKES